MDGMATNVSTRPSEYAVQYSLSGVLAPVHSKLQVRCFSVGITTQRYLTWPRWLECWLGWVLGKVRTVDRLSCGSQLVEHTTRWPYFISV